MTTELVFEDPSTPAGEIVGALEIIDERLITVVHTVVRSAQPTPLTLAPGRYLAQGWLPDGQLVRTTFDESGAGSTPVVLRQKVSTTQDRNPIRGGWLRGWRFSGRAWSPDVTVQVDRAEADTIDATTPAVRGGAGVAVQVVDEDGSSTITMMTATTGFRLDRDGCVLPRASSGATLLGYLHRGNVAAAHVVARQILDDLRGPPNSLPPLTATVVGYYLVRTGHELARPWIADLIWTQPDSIDVVVLNACLLQRDPEASDEAIRSAFLRAAAGGLPVVAQGVHSLGAGLVAAGERGTLSRLRSYLVAMNDGALTAFPAEDPAMPSQGVVITARQTPHDGIRLDHVVSRNADTAPTTERTPANDGERDALCTALRLLRARGIGAAPSADEVGAGPVTLLATVVRNGDAGGLDLELEIRAPARSFADVVVDVQVEQRLHCIGTFDDEGRCTVGAIPPGAWQLAARYRGRGRAPDRRIPLAPLPETALLAAGTVESVEVLKTRLPDQHGMVVVRRDRDGTHRLELVVAAATTPSATAVEYRRSSGSSAFRLLPVLGRGTGLASSSMTLDDFDSRAAWQVVPAMTTDDMTGWADDDVRASVRAAASAHTRDAWRALADRLTPRQSAIIAAELAAQEAQPHGDD